MDICSSFHCTQNSTERYTLYFSYLMFVEINYNCVKLLQMMLRSGNNEIFSNNLTRPCKLARFLDWI